MSWYTPRLASLHATGKSSAADSGSSRAAAPRQTSAERWRQQPFRPTQKAVPSSGQVRLQQLRLYCFYHAQMVRLGRGTALSKARSNGRREVITADDAIANFHPPH